MKLGDQIYLRIPIGEIKYNYWAYLHRITLPTIYDLKAIIGSNLYK